MEQSPRYFAQRWNSIRTDLFHHPITVSTAIPHICYRLPDNSLISI